MTIKAQIAKVPFPVEDGFIEGLRDEYGDFYAGVSQLCAVFSLSKAHASRDFKALLGKEISFTKLKTPLNSQAVNAVPIKYLEPVILELAFKGNAVAIHCSRALVSLSIKQLFHDAFDVEFGEADRKAHLDEWRPVRQRLRDVHGGMQQAAINRGHKPWDVHDYMTLLVFGDTADDARLKALVDPKVEPEIGLNHQEEIAGMNQLIRVKKAYTYMRNVGTWEQQVERAAAKR